MDERTIRTLLKLEKLRKRLFDAIELSLKEDGHCKSYEGAFSIVMPNYFNNNGWSIALDCYVIGPGRHYSWSGKDLEEAYNKAEKDIISWINEEAAW